MLLSLSTLLKPCLEFINPRTDHQSCYICIRRAHNHVRHIILMPRSIKHSPSLLLCLKSSLTNFNSFPPFSLFLVDIHTICEPPRISPLTFSLLFILSNIPLINLLSWKHNIPTYCTLPNIDMTNKYNRARISGLINSLYVFIFMLTYNILLLGRERRNCWLRRRFYYFSRFLVLLHFDVLIILI